MKKCKKCNIEKDLNDFYNDKRCTFGKKLICKSCDSKRLKEYRFKNREKILAQKRNHHNENKQRINERSSELRNKVKLECFTAYGGKCVCCGEENVKFLTIDHINQDGYLESCGGSLLAYRLRKFGYPKQNYQLLCYNCNCARSFVSNGVCPHKEEKTVIDDYIGGKL